MSDFYGFSLANLAIMLARTALAAVDAGAGNRKRRTPGGARSAQIWQNLILFELE
jgi:hypothetical protein